LDLDYCEIVMNHPIPTTAEEIIALRDYPINEELLAAAIAGVIQLARAEGKSLQDLTAEILAEDDILDRVERRWIRDLVAQAWIMLP